MKVEKIKEKARRHEQREEWQKALDLYEAALQKEYEEDQEDITLLNRIGDIQTRLGQIERAVERYEKAIDLYLEAELPNNAIAICKKVLRNLPDRSIFFLRMGQIRAGQGFLTDARQNFLTYAERMTADGDIETALSALIEFVALSPEDLEIRLGLAAQLELHSRTDEAVAQYVEGYRQLVLADQTEEAEAIQAKVAELAPDEALPDVETILAGEVSEETEGLVFESTSLGGDKYLDPVEAAHLDDLEVGAEFGVVSLPEDAETQAMVEAGLEAGPDLASDVDLEVGVEGLDSEKPDEDTETLPTFDFDAEEEAEALPTFGFQEEEGQEDAELEVLPTFGFGDDDEVEAAEPLPILEFGKEEAPAEEPAADVLREEAFEDAMLEALTETFSEPETVEPEVVGTDPPLDLEDHAEVAERGDLDGAMEIVQVLIQSEPDEVGHYQRLVEYAFRKADNAVLVSAYMQLAGCLVRTGALAKARAVYQQVLALSPGHEGAAAGIQEVDGVSVSRGPAEVTSSEEYVDLGSMILGEGTEESTRWKVTAEAPSGDDQADFAKMLSQFKEKVSEHVAADDVSAHRDLGTAYMEMGLLDEAIGEFQMALRASPHHLPTHEVMGRCWMEAGKPDMAARSLRRALDAEFEIEDELIGIYYLMGRAMEDLGEDKRGSGILREGFLLGYQF